MKVEFPRPLVRIDDCIAIFKRKIGHRRKAGPCIIGNKQILFEGEYWKPNRLSYRLNITTIPRTPTSLKKGLVLHTCDHEWCVNPKHLYFGTQSQNMYDRYARYPNMHFIQSNSHLGLKHTIATRRKMSLHHKGFTGPHSLKSKRKMSISHLKRTPQQRSEAARHASMARWHK